MASVDRPDAPKYYDRYAEKFAARYDSVSFEAVHPFLLHFLPESGCALDVGAGSGRDARALTNRGLSVTAIEPAAGLRQLGELQDRRIIWVDDRLPDLTSQASKLGSYDFILCSAVLMLVGPSALVASFSNMGRLLKSTGRLAINIRDPMTDEPTDLFFKHTDNDVIAAATAAGLVCIARSDAEDALGRASYRWRSFIFANQRY